MTRKPFVVANWKMNGSLKANDEWLCAAMPQMSGTRLNCDVAVCAPFVYIPQLVIGFEHSATLVGAQNCAQYAQGAYTGEVSAAMLADIGCDLVILGHSERRTLFDETDETVAEKVKIAFDNGVMPIVCVGETLEEREAGKTIEVVSRQLRAVLDKVGIMPLVAGAVAYEPVWAIGTGKTATAAQAQEMHAFIRQTLAEKYGKEVAGNCSILYGGSCKPSNAKELFANPDVDGGLIGGAALEVESFMGIIEAF